MHFRLAPGDKEEIKAILSEPCNDWQFNWVSAQSTDRLYS